MPHANFMVGLKVLLRNPQDQILALEAQQNGPMAGFYDLPGGRIDDNEVGTSFAKVIDREIKEELGPIQYALDPMPVVAQSWMWPNNQPITFVYYSAMYTGGEIKISEEHLSAKWFELSPENLEKYFTSYHLSALKQYVNNS